MILIPALWLVVLFLIPFLIVLKISLSDPATAQPPYRPLLDLGAGLAGLREFVSDLDFENFATLVNDDL
ncbi:MAG TPA: putrescine ABC transporter permease PotH, partial [Enterovirga sp.]